MLLFYRRQISITPILADNQIGIYKNPVFADVYYKNMFIPMTHRAKTNLAKEKSLNVILGKKAVRWAKRIVWASQLPGMIEEIYARGIDTLPDVSTPAPIMAFAHKKFIDVPGITVFMAGRPVSTFHGVTIMSQAGIHSGIYPYSEWIPDIFKNPLTDPMSRLAAKKIGNIIKDLFTSFNTYPVYREGRDVPDSREKYNANSFGGKRILGMSYEEYKNFAAKKTRQTLMQVFKDIADLNKSFVIAPEGSYTHDGKIQPLEDFIAFAANRKKRMTVACGVSYDELCPDTWGRVAGYISAAKPLPPPNDKREIPDWLVHLRELLLENQTIVASHIIATVLKKYEKTGSLSETEFLDSWNETITELENRKNVLLAPVLSNTKEREFKLKRFFLANGKKWLTRKKNIYYFNTNTIEKFDPLQRTINSLDWNYNQINHLF